MGKHDPVLAAGARRGTHSARHDDVVGSDSSPLQCKKERAALLPDSFKSCCSSRLPPLLFFNLIPFPRQSTHHPSTSEQLLLTGQSSSSSLYSHRLPLNRSQALSVTRPLHLPTIKQQATPFRLTTSIHSQNDPRRSFPGQGPLQGQARRFPRLCGRCQHVQEVAQ